MNWFDKRYHSLNYFLKNKFGEKVIKISLDLGLSCPNRDGTLSHSGCIFCSGEGSGEFSGNKNEPLAEQFDKGILSLKGKWEQAKYIAYFQSFTNTYAPIEFLRQKYTEVLTFPNVVGISIATRPDCISSEVLELLAELRKKTFVFVELGFQTSNAKSIQRINRCYENQVFQNVVEKLKEINVNVVCHVILGLPKETKKEMLETVQYVCENKIDGIKIHLLHVLQDTALSELYENNYFEVLSFQQYIDLVLSCLEIIPADIVIHRLTGDAPRHKIVAPMWSLNKKLVLNTIDTELKSRNLWQSKNISAINSF